MPVGETTMAAHQVFHCVSLVFSSPSKTQAEKVSTELLESLKRGQQSGDVIDLEIGAAQPISATEAIPSDYSAEEEAALIGLSYSDVFSRARQSD
jgi:hypothetical protein